MLERCTLRNPTPALVLGLIATLLGTVAHTKPDQDARVSVAPRREPKPVKALQAKPKIQRAKSAAASSMFQKEQGHDAGAREKNSPRGVIEKCNVAGLSILLKNQDFGQSNKSMSPVGIAAATLINSAFGPATEGLIEDLQPLSNLKWEEESVPFITGITPKNAGVQIQNASCAIQHGKFSPAELEKLALANVQTFDIGPNTIQEVAKWVTNVTKGKIDGRSMPLDLKSVFTVVNVIYFAGKWEKAFDASLTKSADFFISQGNKVKVPMMNATESFGYREDSALRAEIVRLPYLGNKFSCYVILPNEQSDLMELKRKLNPAAIEKLTQGLKATQMSLSLPKFKSTSMTIVRVGNNATIKQKVHVEFDEQGTVAASVTMYETARDLYSGPLELNINRPFMHVIRNNADGRIYFIGTVVDPSR